MMHKKACKQFAEDKQTKDMDYWNLCPDETKINLFGSDGVTRMWRPEPILPIRRVCKLRRAHETPGGTLTLKYIFILVSFLKLDSGYENMNAYFSLRGVTHFCGQRFRH